MVLFVGILPIPPSQASTEKVYHSLDHTNETAQELGFGDIRVEEAF